MAEDIEVVTTSAFAFWLQNFFGITIPIVGAILEGWPGFFIGTGVSLLVFFIVSGIMGVFNA